MSRYPTAGLTGATAADLAWLPGSWSGYHGNASIEEYWSTLAGGTLMGMFRLLRDNQIGFYELITLAPEGAFLVMRFKHFHADLIGWEEKDSSLEFVLVHYADGEAVFFERNVPDPRWLIYRREGEDALVVYFEHEGAAVTADDQFIFTRHAGWAM
ncbi:MAG TPA: DUF6265 family protein [Ktedonobacterales bacterium]|jgi:hypothetical protein